MKRISFVALASVSLLSLAAPAVAQEAAKDGDENVADSGDIVVQARRRDESSQEVPLVVNAVTADSMAKLNIREFQDVQTLVPGLQMSSSANGIGTQATLRGVAFDVNASGNNGTIEFYQNDAPISSGILFQSMFDVGQVEVLRGPQGTLRGRASPSGSITVTTHRVDLNEAGGYVQGTVTDTGTTNANLALNVPIVEGKLGVRVAGVYDQGDGNEVRSVNNALDPYIKTRGGRVSLRAEPVDFLSLSGSYTTTNRKALQYDQAESMSLSTPGGATGSVLIDADDRRSMQYIPRRYEQTFKVWNWQAQARFAGQKLDYVGSHSTQKLFSVDPNDDGGAFSPTSSQVLREAAQTTNTSATQTTHELRLSNEERVAGMFDYVVGGLYNKMTTGTTLITQTPIFTSSFLTLVNTPVARPSATKEQSLFGNVTAHIGEKTEISVGTRYIDYHSEGNLIIGGVTIPAAAENRDASHWIYSASVKHNVTPDLMVYASFGSSWRPGSSTNAIQFRDLANPGPLLSSFYFPGDETSNSYEIGFKSSWLDRRLRLNVTAYHQDFKNYAYSSPNVYAAGLTVAGAQTVFLATPAIAVGVPAKVDGVEGEIDFRASDRFSVGVSASYSISKIKNGVVPCNNYGGTVPTYAQIIAANNGQQISTCTVNYRAGLSAPFAATAQSEYKQPINDTMEGYVRGLMTFSGKSQNDPANAFDDIKAYALFNFFAGIRASDGGWELGGYVKNAFNAERVLSRTAQPLGVSYQQITSTGVVGLSTASAYRGITMTAPREFGVSLTARFGSR